MKRTVAKNIVKGALVAGAAVGVYGAAHELQTGPMLGRHGTWFGLDHSSTEDMNNVANVLKSGSVQYDKLSPDARSKLSKYATYHEVQRNEIVTYSNLPTPAEYVAAHKGDAERDDIIGNVMLTIPVGIVTLYGTVFVAGGIIFRKEFANGEQQAPTTGAQPLPA